MWICRPLDLDSDATTIQERRLQALAPCMSPLILDVPPPAPPSSVLDKISARQIQATIAKNRKKAGKERRELIKASSSSSSSSDSSDNENSTRIDKLERELYELELELQEINMKAQKKTLNEGQRKARKVEEDRCKDIARVEKKKEKLLRQYEKRQSRMNQRYGGAVNQAYPTPRPKQNKKQREADEKASKKSKKLKWIVVTDLQS